MLVTTVLQMLERSSADRKQHLSEPPDCSVSFSAELLEQLADRSAEETAPEGTITPPPSPPCTAAAQPEVAAREPSRGFGSFLRVLENVQDRDHPALDIFE